MSYLTFTVRFQGGGTNIPYEADPAECPLCHHAVAPELRVAELVSGSPQIAGSVVEAAYRCTNRSCGKLFIATFNSPSGGMYLLHSLAPRTLVPPVISTEIRTVSEKFARISEQAAHAEASGLDEIAGLGYRKALEFLIKDYLSEGQDEETKKVIASEFLGVTIAKRVDDPKLKACATRAIWLGNDEAHYIRLWTDKDISHLKILIQLSVHWITSHVLTKQFENEMPAGKKH